METGFWHKIKEELLDTFEFIQAMDQRATAIVEEGLFLVWDDLCTFFAALIDRP